MMPFTPIPSEAAPSSMSLGLGDTTTHSCCSLPAVLADSSSTSRNLPSPAPSSTSLNAKTLHAPSSLGAVNSRSRARQKRNSWMRSSVVRRAATVVDEEVAALSEKSPFLNQAHTNPEIALFHRLEVQLGKALGRGGFAEVYTVAKLDVYDDDDDERSVRRRECANKLTTPSGRPAYAIKFLRKKLLSNTKEFQHAAIDLAVESKYLAALSHKNIITLCGLTRGGTGAFRTGKHDDFFIIMDHLEETLEHRMQRWQRRHEKKSSSPPQTYFPRTLLYAQQIADALAYLHDKSIVYRDLKPQNLGFRERDVIQLFDFGLCRELPKPKGQSHHDEDMEDEETFHMSGVGTQRYMAPEILNTRRYNLKADVYSWSMVALEMMTWKKPFSEYTPEEHQKCVAGLGERPRLVSVSDEEDEQPEQNATKHAQSVLMKDWPSGMDTLLKECWTQNVADRLTMQSVLERIGSVLADYSREVSQLDSTTVHAGENNISSNASIRPDETEVVLEFPSYFSPRHQLSEGSRQRQRDFQRQQGKGPVPLIRDDSDAWFGDRQSDASNSYRELTMTSASTTLHDSSSIG